MVEGAALEMLCPERDLGFESLTLCHNGTPKLITNVSIPVSDLFVPKHSDLFVEKYGIPEQKYYDACNDCYRQVHDRTCDGLTKIHPLSKLNLSTIF